MKCVASFFFTVSTFFSLAQPQKSIQVFISPFIQKYGNLNNQYTEASHENIDVRYLKKPGNEFGINYLQTYPNNWGWSVGLSWKNEYHRFYYQSNRYFKYGALMYGVNYRPLNAFSKEIAFNAIGLNAGVYRQLNKTIRLGFMLHQYFPDYKASDEWINFEQSSGSVNDYGITEKIRFSIYPRLLTVPELNVSVLLFKHCNLTIGSRLKFWSFKDYLKVDVYGSFDTTDIYDYDPTHILHKSAINSKDLSYYFGITYDIPVSRKN